MRGGDGWADRHWHINLETEKEIYGQKNNGRESNSGTLPTQESSFFPVYLDKITQKKSDENGEKNELSLFWVVVKLFSETTTTAI